MKGMKLRIFNSWEEAAVADARDTICQSPIERIRETVALILRVYGVTEEDLRKRRGKLHINIIQSK
ncbi:MAG: hypothetical protein JWQ38_1894 [Flavipsychrobacter sp.]|nr:hypothetical protein [Flavipsychrobacter sp.]